jgi:hypothetical protein
MQADGSLGAQVTGRVKTKPVRQPSLPLRIDGGRGGNDLEFREVRVEEVTQGAGDEECKGALGVVNQQVKEGLHGGGS